MSEPWEDRLNVIDLLLDQAERSIAAMRLRSSQQEAQIRRFARLVPPLAQNISNHDAIMARLAEMVANHDVRLAALEAIVARLDRLIDRVFKEGTNGPTP